jgi:hypothetical protein
MAIPPKAKPRGVRRSEPGGESVSVVIRVNGRIEYVRYAVLEGTQPNGVSRYKVDSDERLINHNRNQSYVDLAEKLLRLT